MNTHCTQNRWSGKPPRRVAAGVLRCIFAIICLFPFFAGAQARNASDNRSPRVLFLFNAAVKADHQNQAVLALALYKEALRAALDEHDLNIQLKINMAIAEDETPERAIPRFERAIALASQTGNGAMQVKALHELAYSLRGTGAYKKALRALLQERDLCKRLHDLRNEINAVISMGSMQFGLKQPHKAAAAYTLALRIARTGASRQLEIDTLMALGLNRMDGSADSRVDSLSYYERAQSLAKRINDPKKEMNAALQLAMMYKSNGQGELAAAKYKRAYALAHSLSSHAMEVQLLESMADMESQLGHTNQARQFLESAQNAATDWREKTLALETLASFLVDHGASQEAKTTFDAAYAIRSSHEMGDPEGLLMTRAGYCLRLNDRPQALELMEKVYAAGPNLRTLDYGANLLNMGSLAWELGHYSKALTYLDLARKWTHETSNLSNEATAFNAIAGLYRDLNQPSESMRYAQQARTLGDKLHDTELSVRSLFELALAEKARNHFQQAHKLAAQALSLADASDTPALRIDLLSLLGELSLELGYKERGLRYCQQAVAFAKATGRQNKLAVPSVVLSMAHLAMGKYSEALSGGDQALTVARHLNDRLAQIYALGNLRNIAAREGNQHAAIVFGKEAVNLLQSVRSDNRGLDKRSQSSFTTRHAQDYRALANLLISGRRYSEAMRVMELLKEEEYFNYLRREPIPSSQRIDLTPRESDWVKRFDRLARSDVHSFVSRSEGMLSLPSRAPMTLEGEPLGRMLNKLPGTTAAIYTLVTDKQARVLLVLPNSSAAAESTVEIRASELTKKVLAFRQVLGDPLSDYRPLASELYDLLVRPIEKQLEEGHVTSIVWSLDGALRYIPVAALYDNQKNQFLIEKYPGSIFTPQTIAAVDRISSTLDTSIGMGVSKAHLPEFTALPGVPSELSALREILHGTTYLDEAFTRKSLFDALDTGPQLLHFSTHFAFRPGDATKSFLLLGDGSKITIDDLNNRHDLFKNVELLVLSACDTAMGDEGDGSEFESFALLAQRRGASSVLATLWPVDDSSTAMLMGEFYRTRRDNPSMSKSEVLRSVQMRMISGALKRNSSEIQRASRGANAPEPSYQEDPMRPFAHPYFWAPVILIGNSR